MIRLNIFFFTLLFSSMHYMHEVKGQLTYIDLLPKELKQEVGKFLTESIRYDIDAMIDKALKLTPEQLKSQATQDKSPLNLRFEYVIDKIKPLLKSSELNPLQRQILNQYLIKILPAKLLNRYQPLNYYQYTHQTPLAIMKEIIIALALNTPESIAFLQDLFKKNSEAEKAALCYLLIDLIRASPEIVLGNRNNEYIKALLKTGLDLRSSDNCTKQKPLDWIMNYGDAEVQKLLQQAFR